MAEYQSPPLTPWVDFQAYLDRINYQKPNPLPHSPMMNFPHRGAMAAKPNQVIYNPDGSTSSERTFGVGFNIGGQQKEVLIPSIFPNKQGLLQKYAEDVAIRMYMEGKLKPVGIYSSVEEANKAAADRSAQGGRNFKDKK